MGEKGLGEKKCVKYNCTCIEMLTVDIWIICDVRRIFVIFFIVLS